MRWTYAPTTRTLFVHLHEDQPAWRVVMADGVIVDVDRSSRLLGIEVIDPHASWDVAAIAKEFNLADDDAAALRRVSQTVSTTIERPRPVVSA